MNGWFRNARWIGAGLAIVALLAAPWWGPRALSHFDFFHVRRIEYEGVRYARIAELMSLLRVDTLQSIWQPLDSLSARLERHDMVSSASVHRRLPSTLLVRVTERVPIALVRGENGLQVVDDEGRVLPIDLLRTPLDLPIVPGSDSALVRILAGLRQSMPELYARITTADRVGRNDLRFMLGTVAVLARSDVTIARFGDILPVEADLARTDVPVRELDLRFRDQVIARKP